MLVEGAFKIRGCGEEDKTSEGKEGVIGTEVGVMLVGRGGRNGDAWERKGKT